MTETQHEPAASYDGPAHIGDTQVEVRLKGHFQPIDGLFHWWGRIAADAQLPQASGATVTLQTPYGEAAGRLSDVDTWGRFRVSGTGKPPF